MLSASTVIEQLEAAHTRIPGSVIVALARMSEQKTTGQILLNFNCGSIQSFEVKEHTRITKT